ncbi:MAG: fibronectin type III domain-containing protein, partial [Thermoplasmatota archaeon]
SSPRTDQAAPAEWGLERLRDFQDTLPCGLYEGIYDDIDLKVYSRGASLKYDLIVHPGGDVSDIKISYRGADTVQRSGASTLEILCGGLTLMEGPLICYQESVVESRYILDGNTIGFDIPSHDPQKELIIDPLLLASSYVGGNNWDRYPKVEMDHLDRPVIAMSTDSTNMPTSAGSYSTFNRGETDIFVAKFSKDLSSLISSTYFGGSDYEELGGISISSSGRIHISGGTNSTNMPVTSGSYMTSARGGMNAFAVCFPPDMSSLYYSTYVGGDLVDRSTDIDVDGDGAAYLTGITYSTDFPVSSNAFQRTRSGYFDTFVTKLLPDGSDVAYSTLIGGDGELWGERSEALVVDSSGRAIISGMTVSDGYPVTEGSYTTDFGFYMGFVTMFSADGSSLEFSTLFSNGTYIHAMDLGPDNSIFITGRTVSVAGDFKITADAYDRNLAGKEDAFFSVLNHNGSALQYSTYLGADEKYMDQDEFEELERAWDIKAGVDGRVYVVGETDSIRFPTTMGAFDRNLNDREGFVTIFSPNWSVIEYSSLIGGREQDTVSGVAINASRGMYICGDTYSNYPNHDFPVTEGAYDQSFSSAYDSYLARFKLDSFPPGAPTDLSYFSEDSFINLTWSPPSSDGGEEIISYRIYRGNSPQTDDMSYMAMVDPDILVYNDTSPQNGRTYYYGIRAENVVSQGEWSTLSAVASTSPGAPIIYKVGRSDGALNISWYRPNDDGGIQDLSYNLYMGENATALSRIATDIDEEWYNITGLVNGRSYHIGVSARNWRGEGPLSDIVRAVPQRPPSSPRDLEASLSPFRVHLTWKPPLENGGSGNITYEVLMGENMSAIRSVVRDLNITQTEVQISTIGKEMLVFVRAWNELGPGDRSDILLITPLGDLSRPLNLSASEGGDHINLTWKPPVYSGGARNMTYVIYQGWNRTNLTVLEMGINTTGYTVNPVIPGREYFFAVAAFNSAWEGGLSEIVSVIPYQVPSRPTGLAGRIGNGFVNLSWEPSLFMGGDDNVSYKIYMAEGNGSFGYLYWTNLNETMVRGLANGVDYSFYVRARNIKGDSLRSEIIVLRPLTIPSRPRNPYYYDDDGILNVTWDEPLDNGGSNLTRYSILVGSNESNLEPFIENITSRYHVLSGLNNGERYYIRIIAANEMGNSPPSELLIGIPMKLPSAPLNLNITWQEGSVLIKWDEPEDLGGGDVYYYHIYKGPDPGNMTKLRSVSGAFLEYYDLDIDGDETYYYKIACETTKGRGPPSEVFKLEPIIEGSKEIDLPLPVIAGASIFLVVIIAVVALLARRKKSMEWNIEE